MKIVNGQYASAKIFTDDVEDYAVAQIQQLCNQTAFQGCKIRVMPDVHPGKVGTIGFTTTVEKQILPNVVGIDIGCGITLAKLRWRRMEFQKLDRVIRETIPVGKGIRKKPHRFYEMVPLEELRCYHHIRLDRAIVSLGTLGGGNHFIELDQDREGNLYLAIHSGSRHLGKEVTEYYLKKGQQYLKEKGENVVYELTYLEGQFMEDYLHDLQIVQEFAEYNRRCILDELVKAMKWKPDPAESFIHNYVEPSPKGFLLRKGAVSAKEGEKVVVPINMRDGILIGTGLGNPDWNESAPHGAGRIMKREAVKEHFTVSGFQAEMKGIYCSCIGKDTLDEAPFAYRGLKDIREAVADTMEVTEILKPIYNFKAGQE